MLYNLINKALSKEVLNMELKEYLRQRLEELVKLKAESLEERPVADYIISWAREKGFEVVEDNAGKIAGSNAGNVIVRRPPRGKDKWVMLCAHMDSVKLSGDVEYVFEGDVMKSTGKTILSADDRAGIAAIMYIFENADKLGIDVGLEGVFTIAEEIGLIGAKNLTEKLNSKVGFVLDSEADPGSIDVVAPYHDKFEAVFKGKASHAGVAPEEGKSAIVSAARAIAAVEWGRIDEETTCNVGTISGGEADNIVAPSCKVTGEARSRDEKKLMELMNRIENAFKSQECEVEWRHEREYDGYNHYGCELESVFKEAAQAVGVEFKWVPTGGGSDTNVFNARGVKTFNVGIAMKKPHTNEEYIDLSELAKSTEFLIEILKRI